MRIFSLIVLGLLNFNLKGQVGLTFMTNGILLRTHAMRINQFDHLIKYSPAFQYGVNLDFEINKKIGISVSSGFLISNYSISLDLDKTGWLPKEHSIPLIQGFFPVYQIPLSLHLTLKELRKWSMKSFIGGSFLFNNGSDDLQHIQFHSYENEKRNGSFFIINKYVLQDEGSNGFVITMNSGFEIVYKIKNNFSLTLIPGFQFGTRNLNTLIVHYYHINTEKRQEGNDRILLDCKGSGFSLGIAVNYLLAK